MTWRELLERLDIARVALIEGKLKAFEESTLQKLNLLRTELRMSHPKALLDETIPEGNVFATEVVNACAPYYTVPDLKQPEMVNVPYRSNAELSDLFSCVPDDTPKIKEIIPRADGEGRMVVMKRDTPLIVRPPDLTEVTEEELGKP